jgi:hypothetical protein
VHNSISGALAKSALPNSRTSADLMGRCEYPWGWAAATRTRDLIHLNLVRSPRNRLTVRSDRDRLFWLRCRCSGQEFRFGNQNAVRMEEPIPHVFGLAELDLCRAYRAILSFSFDLNRALADFRFMAILSKHVLHKPSYVASHSDLLIALSVGREVR